MTHDGNINTVEHENQLHFLETTLDTIDAYVCAKDCNGRYTYVNQKVCDLFGTEKDEIIGFDDSKFFESKIVDYIKHNDEQVIKNGETINSVDLRVIAKTGESRYLMMVKKPLTNKNGEIIGLLGVCSDITPQKETELKLKKTLQHLGNALTSTRQGWFNLDIESGDISVIGHYAETLGYSPDKFNSSIDNWKQHLHPDDKEEVITTLEHSLLSGAPATMDYRRKAKDGSWVHIRTTAEVAEWDQQNKPIRLVGMLTDISAQNKAKLHDKIRNSMLEKLVNGISLNIILDFLVRSIETQDTSMIGSILLLNNSGTHFSIGSAPNLPTFFNEAVEGLEIGFGVGSCGTAAFLGETVIVEDIQHHPYWAPYKELATKANLASCWSTPILGFDKKILGTVAIYHADITTPTNDDIELTEFIAQLATIAIERSKTNEQLELASRVFNNTHEGIMITDKDRKIIDINPAFTTITGYSHQEVLGETPRILSSGKHGPEFFSKLWNEVNEKGHWQGEIWNKKKNGELFAELINISSLYDDHGNVINHIGVFSDITHSKQQQDKLNLMAHYDVLTGLPNRALFADRFHQAIVHTKRTETNLAVCFLDLDNFKPINDNFGHDAGDQLLLEVSKRISASIREEDTVSRQGGDEFTLLLSDLESREQCELMLKRILNMLAQPYLINGYSHSITASIGATLYPDDDQDIDTLIRHADNAMYQAKQSGKHRYKLFDSQHDQAAMQKQHRLQEIKQALLNEQLCLYYQPKVNMLSGDVIGVEALIRWNHPEKGLIPPLDFLPIIDGSLLELKVGNWVINQAIKQMAYWLTKNIKLEISINISSHHLLSPDFFLEIATALSKEPSVDSTLLQLEILESSALNDLDTISTIIKSCQDNLGVSIALDDFGTGYSSLAHLRSLSANIIKIDQSFVSDMLDDPSDYTIIDGVIGLADAFDRDIIAEGVETTQDGLMLITMGCNLAQGYGISRPLPGDKIENWLSSYGPNEAWIACGKKAHSNKDKKLKLFQLTSQRWMNHFIANINTAPEEPKSWSIMSTQGDHMYQWINRAKKEQIYSSKTIKRLLQCHKKLHATAEIIRTDYQTGKIDKAKTNLTQLHTAYDEMIAVLH